MGTKEKLAKILTKTARILPGIGSYQDKESVRESDKKLRDYLSGELARYLNAIEKLKTDLSRKGSLSFLKELDDISRQIDKLSRTIRYASRGYAGVFASYQVDEKALSDLFEFDRSLKGEITGLTPLISQICAKDGGLASPLLNELRDRLFGVEQKVAERETLIG